MNSIKPLEVLFLEAIPNVQAQMKSPDINLQVEIREEAAYLSYETIRGAGGFPVGTSGKGMLMLSGGNRFPCSWLSSS